MPGPRILLLSLMVALTACDGTDGSAPDAAIDPAIDAGGVPLPGFGDISGACGVLDDEEWSVDAAFLFDNAIDFGATGYTDDDLDLLTDGGQEIVADGNAGGDSLLSEVFAFEMLHRCELAILLKTETEIEYTDPSGKLTDLLVEIDGNKLGVSVTRAVGFPREDPYTVEQATALLEDKLADIHASTANVAPADAWTRQILHVIAYADQHADSIATAFGQVDTSLRADTLVIVTVSDGDDEFLY